MRGCACAGAWRDRRTAAEGEEGIPFKIAVHDGEEDLEEEVDGIYDHREEV